MINEYILRKTIEGYLNSFDNIIFDKIIFKQSISVSDRSNNMQFSKIQNKIYGPLVTIQYHTKCTYPHNPKFTSKFFSVFTFRYNLYLVIAYALIPTTDTFYTHFSVIARKNLTISHQKYTYLAYPSQYDSKIEVKHRHQLQN